MSFQRVVTRVLPDGSTRKVYPFHVSLEGMESVLLCRDEEDFRSLENYFFISACENNCLIIIHVVMSNHGHLSVLATDYESACRLGETIKQRVSMYLQSKYGEQKRLSRTTVNVQLLDNEWYVRNALAYIVKNVADTGMRLEDYRWCGYDAMFVQGKCPGAVRAVRSLTRREKEAIFHSHADLSRVPWLLDREDRLVHASACDWRYLEEAFGGDQTFFLKAIGTVNDAQMQEKLVNAPRRRQNDAEFIVTVTDIAGRWFQKPVSELTLEQKTRIVPYLFRCFRTTPSQLARCLQLERDAVLRMLNP